MDPQLLRTALRLGMLVTLSAAAMLPFLDRASASFVVDVLALAVGLVFVAGVVILARRESGALPRDGRDTTRRSRYNVRDPHGPRSGEPAPGGREE